MCPQLKWVFHIWPQSSSVVRRCCWVGCLKRACTACEAGQRQTHFIKVLLCRPSLVPRKCVSMFWGFFVSASCTVQCGHTAKGHREWLACVRPVRTVVRLKSHSCVAFVAHCSFALSCRQSGGDDARPEDLACRYEDRHNQTTPIQSVSGDSRWHECKPESLKFGLYNVCD